MMQSEEEPVVTTLYLIFLHSGYQPRIQTTSLGSYERL